jgi:hypothetical protein
VRATVSFAVFGGSQGLLVVIRYIGSFDDDACILCAVASEIFLQRLFLFGVSC